MQTNNIRLCILLESTDQKNNTAPPKLLPVDPKIKISELCKKIKIFDEKVKNCTGVSLIVKNAEHVKVSPDDTVG